LHHNGIIHRDIKGDNVCMSGFEARIIDFGMARSLIVEGQRADGGEMLRHHMNNADAEEEEETDEPTFVTRSVSADPRSTAQYSAPEALLSRGHYDSKVDVWALGCLLAELLYCCDSDKLNANSAVSSKFTARFLFRPSNSLGSLPLIMRHLVASPEDLVDAEAAGTGGMKKLSDRRWSSMLARGFIDPSLPDAVNNPFAWSDLSSKFPTPAGRLPADEIPIFETLRSLMMRMLSFDPDQRCSAAEALSFLTQCEHRPVRVADSVLEEFKTLQQMLEDIQHRLAHDIRDSAKDRVKCQTFIRHVDPDHPSHPSPLSLLLN
jgi:serine/threonine protein kinase